MTKELETSKKRWLKVEAALKKRELSPENFKILKTIIHPGASDEAALLAYDYCKARKLDPMKKVCHIIKTRVKGKDGDWITIDSIWMAITELRITAFRTGQYVGQSEAEYGPIIEETVGGTPMKYPDWCKITVYRYLHGDARPFTAKVYWKEAYKSKSYKDQAPNDMWQSRTIAQLEKCTEAAALRKAFPEELGSDDILEEAYVEPAGEFIEGETIKKKPEKPSEAPETPKAEEKAPEPEKEAETKPAAPEPAGEQEPVDTFEVVNSFGQLSLRHSPGLNPEEDEKNNAAFLGIIHECEDEAALDKLVYNNEDYIEAINKVDVGQWKTIMAQISFMRNSFNDGML